MNDPFIHEQSQRFAARLISESTDVPERVQRAYRLALGRAPNPAELEAGQTFIASVQQQSALRDAKGSDAEAASWQAFARVLFRLNEFVYID